MRIILVAILLSSVVSADDDFLAALNMVNAGVDAAAAVEPNPKAKFLAYQQRLEYRRMRALDLRREKYSGRRHVYPIYNFGHVQMSVTSWRPVYAGGATY